MNTRLHETAERDALFARATILKHPEAARPEAGPRALYRKPGHAAAIRVNRFFNVKIPGAFAALASMLYGARFEATTPTDTIGTAQHAFDAAFIELTQRWDQIATVLGLPENSFLTSFMGFLGMVVALFFAVFAGIGAAVVHAFKLLSLN